MNNKKRILFFLVSLVIIPIVFGIGNVSILETYYDYYGWIDFGFYLMIFMGLTQEFMAIKFNKGALGSGDLSGGSKAVSIGLSLALAVSLATWEVKSGFYLLQLGPLILIILGGLGLVWLLSWFKKRNIGNLKKFLFYFLVFLIAIYFFFPNLYLYLPWSWADNLIGWLILITLILFLITFGATSDKEEKSGRSWFDWGKKKYGDWTKGRDIQKENDRKTKAENEARERERRRIAEEREAQRRADIAAREEERRRRIALGRRRARVLRGP